MSPENLHNNKACNDTIAMLDARGKTLFALGVYGNRTRLILENSKIIEKNEGYRKLALAYEALKKKDFHSNGVRELMQIDIDTKGGIIADQFQKIQIGLQQ